MNREYDTNLQHEGECADCRNCENRLLSANSDIKRLQEDKKELLEALISAHNLIPEDMEGALKRIGTVIVKHHRK